MPVAVNSSTQISTFARMSSCPSNNLAVAHGWEQHALDANGNLWDAKDMEWPNDPDDPRPNIRKSCRLDNS